MNIKHIHTAAHVSSSLYRIVYTTIMIYALLRRRKSEYQQPDRHYH